jgi:type I restriction enzyme M protein
MNGRDRRGETLFIDARQLGTMATRVLKVFTDEDIAKIQETVQSWKTGEGYEDVAGFCKSASLEEIEKNGFVLTPGRYVGSLDVENDGILFEEKMSSLFEQLSRIQVQGNVLDQIILKNLNLIRGK